MSSIFDAPNNRIIIRIKWNDFRNAYGKILIFHNIKQTEECKKDVSFTLSPNLICDIRSNFQHRKYDNIVERIFEETFRFFNDDIVHWVQYEVSIEFEIDKNTIYWKNANNVIFVTYTGDIVTLFNKSYCELKFRSEKTNVYLKNFIKQMRRELARCRFYHHQWRYSVFEIVHSIKSELFSIKFKGNLIEFCDLSETQQNDIIACLSVLHDSNQYRYCLYKNQRKFKSVVKWIHETNKKLPIPIHYMSINRELVIMIPVIDWSQIKE